MILREATIKYKGYNPDDLKPKSKKRVCVTCDMCGRVRWQPMVNSHSSLCRSCSKKGDKNPQYGLIGKLSFNYGKHLSDEHKDKISKGNMNKIVSSETRLKRSGSNNWNYQGGLITKICEICGDEFKVKRCQSDQRFCSQKCMQKWQSENLVGENNSFYGHKHSDEYKLNHSINELGKLNPNWKGGCDRSHVKPKNQCIQLNVKFKGSEFHHIMSGVGIYIPKNIHRSIWHDLKNRLRITEINKLAFNYLMGDL